MSGTCLHRPLRPAKLFSSSALPNCPRNPRIASPFHQASQRRHEATTRRMTKRLRLPPAPVFSDRTAQQDHIIFNPPSSAPSVHQTPRKFLPRSDPRRQLYASAPELYRPGAPVTQTGTALSGAPTRSKVPLPPPVTKDGSLKYEKKYHLTAEDFDEMRRLRQDDPYTWTRNKLAERFNCSPLLVMMVAKNHEKGKVHERMMEEVKSKWGRRKREAREDRQRRRDSWGRET